MHAKPNIVISKCIEFDHCRYDGSMIESKFIIELKPFVNFHPICPEVEIKLGIPRSPIRLIKQKDSIQLVQPATKKFFTNEMNDFINSFLATIDDIDGFILKSRSPSCGLADVKLYSSIEKGSVIGKTSGMFGNIINEKYFYLAIEDEKRLINARIKEHFFRKIFTLASFRKVKKKQSIQELINFHTINKFLLMAYNQSNLQRLGRIVSNFEKNDISNVLSSYESILYDSFKTAPPCTRNINVLQHILGFFSNKISPEEKSYFLENAEAYRQGRKSLAAVTNILTSWAIRFNEDYLLNQTFFKPYPKELVHIENIDSCNVRDYWK